MGPLTGSVTIPPMPWEMFDPPVVSKARNLFGTGPDNS